MTGDLTRLASITITAPGPWLNENHRLHWRAKAKRVALWREAAAWQARSMGLHTFGEQQVHVTATVHMATARKYDVSNLLPTAKACVDGLRDAGLLIEDDNEHVIGPDMRAGMKWPAPGLRLSLVGDLATSADVDAVERAVLGLLPGGGS